MPQNIHDNFAKEMLSHPDLAEAFLESYLPQEVVDILDFKTLTYLNTSFVSKDLKATFSDMLWEIKLKSGKNVKISILLEHKSNIDKYVVFQILQYLADAYRKQIKEKKKPQLIIPVLYYHGEKEWDLKEIYDWFDEYPEFMKQYLPDYSLDFVNLQSLTTHEILSLQNGLLATALSVQKNYMDFKELNNSIAPILENMRPYLDSNFSRSIFVYMFRNVNFDKVTFKEKIMTLPADTSTKEKVMSLYDQLILEGEEKGIEKTILNAFDNQISLETIKLISGQSIERIKNILKRNKRKI